MERFLTERLQQKFEKICLSLIYQKPFHGFDRPLYSISSFSEKEHKEIVMDLMKQGFLYEDLDLYFLLQQWNGEKGFQQIASDGNMIMRIPRFHQELVGIPICYSPSSMTEGEVILFRLWYEYFQQMNQFIAVQECNPNKTEIINYDTPLTAKQFVEKNEIENDNKIRKLIMDRPGMLDSL